MSKMRNIRAAITAFIKFTTIKAFQCPQFDYSVLNIVYPGCHFEFERGSRIKLGKKFTCRYNNIFNTRGGVLNIGNNVFFNANCILTCHGDINIGDDCKFGPGTKIFDHDHDMSSATNSVKSHEFAHDHITIGNGCWFGADCIILRGTIIGDHCVFGAGSIIKGKYESNSIVVQKRENTIKSWS